MPNSHAFIGVISSNDANSRLLVVRSRRTHFSILSSDTETQQALKNKNISYTPSYTSVPPTHIKITLENNQSFFVPVEECKKAILSSNTKSKQRQFLPKPQQRALLNKLTPEVIQSNKGDVFMIFWSMGSGKTKGVLNCLRQCVFPHSSPASVVVVCPKSCVSNWKNEIASLPFHIDTNKDTLTFFDIMCETQLRKALTNQPNFLKNKILIFDECQTLRNLTTEGASVINATLKASVIILLTGTPIVNSPDEVSYLAKLGSNVLHTLGKGNKVLKGETDHTKLLEAIYTGRVHHYTLEDQERAQRVVSDPERVPMTWYQTFKYFENQSSKYSFYGYSIQTSNRNSYDVRLRLASNYVDDENCPKIKQLVKNIAKYEFPQVVHSAYLASGLEPVKRILDQTVDKVFIFDGKLSGKDRQTLINKYNSNDVNVLLMSNAGSLGINLKWTQAFHNLDPFANRADYEQAIGRALRLNSYTGTPPSTRHNKFLTEITYLATFPDVKTLKLKDIAALQTKIAPFYTDVVPNSVERATAIRQFLTSNIAQHKSSNDEKVWARAQDKQRHIDNVINKLKELGRDDSINAMYAKRAKSQEYRKRQSPKSRKNIVSAR